MIATTSTVELVPLNKFNVDSRLQMRDHLSGEVIEDYADAYRHSPDLLPPVVGFRDSTGWVWLADGFHRLKAALKAGLKRIRCEVRAGTKRDAILYAAGCNAEHGLRRSRYDKRRAVIALLDDPDWKKWSDRQIATACKVSAALVADIRSLTEEGSGGEREARRANGTVYTYRPPQHSSRPTKPARLTGGSRRVTCPHCGRTFHEPV